MPRSQKGQRYILCIIDEVTNILVTVPIFQARFRGNRGSINRKYYNKVLYT